ncbi:MAG: DUF969 domain-containing protein [Negativicutes bacterium]|nr:DUF969 domain-containing protein [Negativicutes bacterium]
MLTLIGVVWVIAGFICRFNPLLVVVTAGILTGLLAGMSPAAVLSALGEAFVKNRFMGLFILVLPVVGVLERAGLRQQAQRAVAGLRQATAGRLLIVYLFLREMAAALGLTSLGGHAQMVRPILSPMAEGAALNRHPRLPVAASWRIRAFAASADNVGLFFGEDIFIAFGAILLMKGFFAEFGIELEPWQIAVWGIPTAVSAFIIHAVRLYRLDSWLAAEAGRAADSSPTGRDDRQEGEI